MTSLDGCVAIVTGAGRGLGREHALLLAAEGARVVVNDVGGSTDGSGTDGTVAEEVAAEIRAAGGEAIVNADSVTDWAGAERMVSAAVDTFGRLDVVVNNAGILRDRMLVNMTEEEFDRVLAVHLKGTFTVTRHAAAHWRALVKSGQGVSASVVNTSSAAGLFNNVGQANYGAAKAAIAALTLIAAKELRRYGVRVNAIAPVARTRLTEQTPGLADSVASPEGDRFDPFSPVNVAPLVVALAAPDCDVTGAVLHVAGGRIDVMEGWRMAATIERPQRWEVDDLAGALREVVSERAAGRLPSESPGADDAIEAILGGLGAPASP
jgi:NAD(P)-dependent dehydrogenase (short-subunit alcohol dehydrogenase family)